MKNLQTFNEFPVGAFQKQTGGFQFTLYSVK